ncbi:MAG: hypothetical protein AAFX50_01590 [Acidobacteriota bacterium]
MPQSDKITVINRTGDQVRVGIDNQYGTLDMDIYGYQAHGTLEPGQSSGFVTTSGSPPYRVGFVTTYSGNSALPCRGLIVRDVFPNAIVTLSTTLGTRPDSQPSDGGE